MPGAGIRPRPFTSGYKEALTSSRLDSTATISEALAAAAARPRPQRVLLSASAVGFYGDTGSRCVDEKAPAGADFLAQCVAVGGGDGPGRGGRGPGRAPAHRPRARPGRDAAPGNGHAVQARPGRTARRRAAVLAVDRLADEVGAIRHLLTAEVAGPVNLTGPTPVTNAEFTAELGAQVHRPTVLPVPSLAIKLALGEFGRRASWAASEPCPTGCREVGLHVHARRPPRRSEPPSPG